MSAIREVYIDDDGRVRLAPVVECTGVAARWCPIHGKCTDNPDAEWECRHSDHCSERDCPLHGDASDHAEHVAR